jgi:hypothetical protein
LTRQIPCAKAPQSLESWNKKVKGVYGLPFTQTEKNKICEEMLIEPSLLYLILLTMVSRNESAFIFLQYDHHLQKHIKLSLSTSERVKTGKTLF